MALKRLINDRADIVTEAIEGFLLSAAGDRLTRLDGFPDIKVVLRRDWDRRQVALVSGGGSGHEPAHLGYVGDGLLTAAVCGDVFASPSVDAVLAAILAVTGDAGCLLIVKNYTGDRLNFGLAAERAKAMGRAVETVIVADDIALPGNPQPRGIAGTLFVHKLAGALAAEGRPLAEIAAEARAAAAATASIGLAIEGCTIYGAAQRERLSADIAALGLGIHGEAGVESLPMAGAAALMEVAADRLLRALPPEPARFAVLLNNLGAVPPLEMAILMRALAATPLARRTDYVIGPGAFMTALDMNGFSLSALRLNDRRIAGLLAPAAPPAWQKPRRLKPAALPVAPPGIAEAAPAPSADPAVRACIETAIGLFCAIEQDLNSLDARAGDGDTGTTFATAARRLSGQLDALPYGEGSRLLQAISDLLRRSMGGSSGVLLAILFEAAGRSFRAEGSWIAAFAAGLAQMKAHGGAARGDRTMIDALEPALDSLQAGGTWPEAARAARAGAEATRAMGRARAGRSAYLGAGDLLDVTDPGAEAVARLFEALAASPPGSG